MAPTLSPPVLRMHISRRAVRYAGRMVCAALFGVAAAHVTLGSPEALLALLVAFALTAILIGVDL